MVRKLLTRSIRPPDETPNDNDPLDVPPATVGGNVYTPGDPHGVEVQGEAGFTMPPVITPSAWSGWPADWATPNWGSRVSALADTAWTCVDLNASVLAEMSPYLVNAAPGLDAGWLTNPDPDIYTSWQEFAKQLWWDYQLGEVFVLVTARYHSGWPARFHVVPPMFVNVEMDRGRRRYTIGREDVTDDILHVRYKSSVDDAHGHGPLEAGGARVVAAEVLTRYANSIATNGLIPSSILEAPEQMSPDQAATLRDDWVQQRAALPGYPAVLSGGLQWKPTQINPKDMALLDLSQSADARIAVMLGVPPFLVGLPSGGDSLTYANVNAIFDYHWRGGLRPKAHACMAALSGWALPRGTMVEVNQDSYVQPEPLVRAQTYQILASIQDPVSGQPVITVQQIREAERLTNATPLSGVVS